MKISNKIMVASLISVLIGGSASVYAATTLDFGGKASVWTQKNCNEKQLSRKKADINDVVCNNSQLTTSNATTLSQQQDKIQTLTTQLSNQQNASPVDFAFFTNYGIRYGNYTPSPIYDADKYSNYSMTFTCTSNTNDKIKYWIETSTDKVNWSPQGYYEVNCNGSYGGASLNQGPTSARYYQIVVFPMTVNNNTNTINSFARFSN